MDPMRRQMICQICPDKKRVMMAKDDAVRINSGLKKLFGSFRGGNRLAYRTPDFHEVVRCQYTAGTCRKFLQYQNELRSAEQELGRTFQTLCQFIESFKDETEASKVRHRANHLLMGNYPQAARFILQKR